ncbi:MAG: hypothetical protein E3J64_07960 [Anaerolineales bacterium]|nr:MAG: hypothetical protein E3J64_07960 [Anaerolineales bacterium]
MTSLEWMAFFVLLIGFVASAAATILGTGAETRAIRSLERAYRRAKTQEMELRMERAMNEARDRAQKALTGGKDAWKGVLARLLVDGQVPYEEPQLEQGSASVHPVPHAIINHGAKRFVLTTDPEAIAEGELTTPSDRVVPLDSGIASTARVEAQALWEYLAGEIPQSMVPREAAWYLVVHEPQPWRARVRRQWWRRLFRR